MTRPGFEPGSSINIKRVCGKTRSTFGDLKDERPVFSPRLTVMPKCRLKKKFKMKRETIKIDAKKAADLVGKGKRFLERQEIIRRGAAIARSRRDLGRLRCLCSGLGCGDSLTRGFTIPRQQPTFVAFPLSVYGTCRLVLFNDNDAVSIVVCFHFGDTFTNAVN